MFKNSSQGFILPLVLLIGTLVVFLTFALNWQNITYLKKMQDLEKTKYLEDAAQRFFALTLDRLNSSPMIATRKSNYESSFLSSGLYINSHLPRIKAGISGVKDCTKSYNAPISTLVSLDYKIEGCAQVAIVFPDPSADTFYYILSLHLYNKSAGLEKFYQAIAYNLTDASYTGMPNWISASGEDLGFSGVEMVYSAECDFFVRKVYQSNPCR